MKRCPQCNRVEPDDSLAFCRTDGSPLAIDTVAVSEVETSLLPNITFDEGRSRSTGPTSVLTAPHAHPSTRELNKADDASPSDTPRKHVASTRNSLMAGAVGILLVTVLGVGSYLKYGRSGQPINSIAVMPFVNESGNMDVEYLSDGMTDALISSLSQLPNLNVKARSSVFRYKGKDTDAKTIGNDLNVEAILNGRVVQRGDQLTLSLELVDVATENAVWSQQYVRKQSDLVTLQSEIARDVSNKLKTKLSRADEQKLTKTYTADANAYQHYLKGRHFWNKRTAENLRKAMEQFQQAADVDPNYALAYAGLADCYVVLGDYAGVPESETNPKVQAFAQRALQLDDSLVEARTSLAYSYALLWQWDRAEKEFKLAIELNPKYATAHHWYSLTLS
ncbi:MAG: hypothetical protein ACR2H6_15555, partial [Pyrinomonadaceae bacterium]